MENPQLRIFIPDATYPQSLEDAHSESDSENFRKGLEAEFGSAFEESNIGAGFDIPAFVTAIDLLLLGIPTAIVWTFFKGKEVEENFESWNRIWRKLWSYAHRNPSYEREGAAILAVGAIANRHSQLPKSIKLLGYRTRPLFELDEIAISNLPLGIQPNIHSLNLGGIVHELHILVDGVSYLAVVNGHEVKIEKVE